ATSSLHENTLHSAFEPHRDEGHVGRSARDAGAEPATYLLYGVAARKVIALDTSRARQPVSRRRSPAGSPAWRASRAEHGTGVALPGVASSGAFKDSVRVDDLVKLAARQPR